MGGVWESGVVGGLSVSIDWTWVTRLPSRALLGDSLLVEDEEDEDGERKREDDVRGRSEFLEVWAGRWTGVAEVKGCLCFSDGGVAHGAR